MNKKHYILFLFCLLQLMALASYNQKIFLHDPFQHQDLILKTKEHYEKLDFAWQLGDNFRFHYLLIDTLENVAVQKQINQRLLQLQYQRYLGNSYKLLLLESSQKKFLERSKEISGKNNTGTGHRVTSCDVEENLKRSNFNVKSEAISCYNNILNIVIRSSYDISLDDKYYTINETETYSFDLKTGKEYSGNDLLKKEKEVDFYALLENKIIQHYKNTIKTCPSSLNHTKLKEEGILVLMGFSLHYYLPQNNSVLAQLGNEALNLRLSTNDILPYLQNNSAYYQLLQIFQKPQSNYSNLNSPMKEEFYYPNQLYQEYIPKKDTLGIKEIIIHDFNRYDHYTETTSIQYNSKGLLQSTSSKNYFYNTKNELIKISSKNTNVEEFQYDLTGNLLLHKSFIAEENIEKHYFYFNDFCIEESYYSNDDRDLFEKENTKVIYFNDKGLIKEEYAQLRNYKKDYVQYTYNKNNQLVSEINNNKINFFYYTNDGKLLITEREDRTEQKIEYEKNLIKLYSNGYYYETNTNEKSLPTEINSIDREVIYRTISFEYQYYSTEKK